MPHVLDINLSFAAAAAGDRGGKQRLGAARQKSWQLEVRLHDAVNPATATLPVGLVCVQRPGQHQLLPMHVMYAAQGIPTIC
jgi:hypothetical protein